MKKINNIIKQLLDLLTYVIPIKLNCVFFESFFGQYNDNPKYISIKLHEMNKNIKIVWSIRDMNNSDIPDYIIKVKPNSLKYYLYKNLAKVSIDNRFGSIMHYGKKDFKLYKKILKKRKKLNISTWHGTPFKKIGADADSNSVANGFFSSSDFLVAGCEFTADKFKSATYNKIPIKMYGTPRNDILFKKVDEVKLKEKLGLPVNKKIILYAPTYRSNDYLNSGINQIKCMNIKNIIEELNKITDEQWSFVFRGHHIVENEIKDLQEFKNGSIINGNLHEDMAEYLKVTDILITDYSSSMFDYILTGKKCVLFVTDYKNYSSHTGVYFDINELPFKIVSTVNDLINELINNDKNYNDNITKYLTKIGNVEDGYASEKICKDIISYLGVKENDR